MKDRLFLCRGFIWKLIVLTQQILGYQTQIYFWVGFKITWKRRKKNNASLKIHQYLAQMIPQSKLISLATSYK